MPPALLDVDAAGGLALLAILGFLLGVRGGLTRGESSRLQTLAGLEAAALAVLGGMLARLFAVAMLKWFAPFGGVFLVWPAAVELAAWFGGSSAGALTSPATIAGAATLVGALAGLFDGLGQVRDFRGRGAAEFALDVTWGLAGTSFGVLIHLANLGWGDPARSGRPGAHRYRAGFRLQPRFAITQGNVCSNLGESWDAALFDHETVHVRQNRWFGPFYTWSYAAWFVLLLPFALAAGLRHGDLRGAAMECCYYNNPWEDWAYRVGGWRPDWLVWPAAVQCPAYVAFFLAAGAAAAWLAASAVK